MDAQHKRVLRTRDQMNTMIDEMIDEIQRANSRIAVLCICTIAAFVVTIYWLN